MFIPQQISEQKVLEACSEFDSVTDFLKDQIEASKKARDKKAKKAAKRKAVAKNEPANKNQRTEATRKVKKLAKNK